jgi:hypothetical protein
VSNFSVQYAGPASKAEQEEFVCKGNTDGKGLVGSLIESTSGHLRTLGTDNESTVKINGQISDGSISFSCSIYVAQNQISNETMQKDRIARLAASEV